MPEPTKPQVTITVTRPLNDGGSVTAAITGPAANQKERNLLIANVAMAADDAKRALNQIVGPVATISPFAPRGVPINPCGNLDPEEWSVAS